MKNRLWLRRWSEAGIYFAALWLGLLLWPATALNAQQTGSGLRPVTAIRSQYAPFNGRCPYYTYADGTQSKERCLVGCVATSLEQVLTYYRYPSVTADTLRGWRTPHYTIESIAPGTKIDFDHILYNYSNSTYSEEEAGAVADLSYYCGIAAHMDWGLSASGADMERLVEPLKKVFKYHYVRHLFATSYTPARWQQLLQEELRNNRPIIYAGYTSMKQGHAFVIDGINSDGLYHINWGYGGNYDGYYDLSILNTFERPGQPTASGGLLGHYCNQEAIFLSPDSVAYEEGDTLTERNYLKIKDVTFSRTPDANGYVTTQVTLSNTAADTVTVALQLMTYQAGDTAIFKNADYTGLAGGALAPGETKALTAYCHFSATGQRIFAISADDSTLIYRDSITVGNYVAASPVITEVDTTVTAHKASFAVHISNSSDAGWCGRMLTYCLFQGDTIVTGRDWRRWTILNLAPGADMVDTMTFRLLQPGTDYTFVIRYPWAPVYSVTFRTSTPAGIASPTTDSGEEKHYTVEELEVKRPTAGGIYIRKKNGRTDKIFIPHR